ncbi:hypothetical protein R3P38DRAFT_2852075 [Favolaschia claudopus]|uniref:Uncharacterized protein n=1 Tax=Favolaschia claudopus TaxID=2862362 RepID=A0AAW0DRA9_9AGAR
MACWRALQITEIVRMICLEAYSEERYLRPTTLLALTTTSKIFSEPALDILWHEQSSLVPLVKCMPESLWEERESGKDAVLHIRRPIESSDISKLLFYSMRVRIFERRPYGREKTVHPEFLRALDMALPPNFMPKLVSLKWTPRLKHEVSLRHFLQPQLQKISLDIEDSVSALSILPYIKSCCPLITDLDLALQSDRPHTVSVMSNLVCGLHHLTDLSVPNLDEMGFRHVAQLPFLTKLSVSWAAEHSTLYPPDFLSETAFPALTSLSVCCRTARLCMGIIQTISSSRFARLYIYPLANWTTAAWQDLHTSLRDLSIKSVFKTLEVEDMDSYSGLDVGLHVVSEDSLRPLLAIKTLNNLTHHTHAGVDVGDDFLEEMARAWPSIGSILFRSDCLHPLPRATLKCLIPFARCCPELDYLELRMNAVNVPEFVQAPGQRIRHEVLEYLEVGESPIARGKEARVAAFISNLFPELDSLIVPDAMSLLDEDSRTHAKSWRRVKEMLPVFCEIRAEEKEFWRQELRS